MPLNTVSARSVRGRPPRLPRVAQIVDLTGSVPVLTYEPVYAPGKENLPPNMLADDNRRIASNRRRRRRRRVPRRTYEVAYAPAGQRRRGRRARVKNVLNRSSCRSKKRKRKTKSVKKKRSSILKKLRSL
jgi:hypothetical protein